MLSAVLYESSGALKKDELCTAKYKQTTEGGSSLCNNAVPNQDLGKKWERKELKESHF